MHAPRINKFLKTIKSPAEATRPATTMGTSVTPATNSYGSYVQLIDGSTAWSVNDGDGYELWININGVGVSAAAHASAVTIGLDLAGGTSYTDFIVDLLGGPAAAYAGSANGSGVWYVFPVRVPNGASVGVKATRSVGTTAFFVMAKIKCRPTEPNQVRAGTFVRTFGATGGGSPSGTAVTPGTTSEGAWASIGTTAEDLWFWEFGYSIENATMSINTILIDIGVGDASNKMLMIDDAEVNSYQTEAITKGYRLGDAGESKSGDLVYARAQVGINVTPSNFTMAVYAVGG